MMHEKTKEIIEKQIRKLQEENDRNAIDILDFDAQLAVLKVETEQNKIVVAELSALLEK